MNTVRPEAAADKMEFLEAIRGLAALAVVAGHLVLVFWPGFYFRAGAPGWDGIPAWLQALSRFPGKFLWDGHIAVTVFFVLSGFVLSLTFFRSGSTASLGSAALRRYPRLMLPVAASVLLAFFLMSAGAMVAPESVAQMNATSGHVHTWLAVYYNFSPTLGSALREGTWGAFVTPARYNFVLWTMPVELAGSFLVYSFLALFGGLRNRWIPYTALGVWLWVNGYYFFIDFVLGMAMADLWTQHARGRSLPGWAAVGLIAAALFVIPWKPVSAVIVVGVPLLSPSVQRFLSTRPLSFLGRVSFGLYLVHMPVVCSLGCGVYLLLCRQLGWTHTAAGLLAAAAALSGSLLVAWLFYRFVDRPTIALTRWLDARLFRRPPGPRIAAPPAVPAVVSKCA